MKNQYLELYAYPVGAMDISYCTAYTSFRKQSTKRIFPYLFINNDQC